MFRFHSLPKPFSRWSTLPLLLILLGVGCQSALRAGDGRRPSAIELTTPVEETIVVDLGDSEEPSISPNGERLLYSSSKRPAHQTAQLYERYLESGQERRITFQNGNALDAQYVDDQTIVYGSSTDEEKESFEFLVPKDKVAKPPALPDPYNSTNDVYLRHLDGDRDIERLSHHPGYDGEPRPQSARHALTWTTAIKNRTQILVKTLPEGPVQTLKNLGTNPTNYLESKDGLAVAWISWDKDFRSSRIRLRQAGETYDVAADTELRKSDLAFSPDSVYLVWSEFDPLTKEIAVFSFEKRLRCRQRFLFLTKADRTQATVTPDGKWLVYRLSSPDGRGRIAKVPFTQRTGACPIIP